VCFKHETPRPKRKEKIMALRKQFQSNLKPRPELQRLLAANANRDVTDEELRDQRVSFAFGNAPADAANITKASFKSASESVLLRKRETDRH
jgi:hypothetical protein